MKLWKFGRILETGTDSWLRSVDQERLPFAWNFRVGFWGQMEQFNFSGKNGSKYDAVPFVKNAPVELGRLGWLVPRFTKSSTTGEIMFLDMVLFFKALNGLVDIDSVALPTLRNIPRITRSTSNEAVTYIPKKCKTVTYQRSFFIRSTRVWNVLPQQLRSTTINLQAFRKSLLDYYFLALTNVYDQDDTRTWKSICTKCNTARDLSHATYCCVWVLPC